MHEPGRVEIGNGLKDYQTVAEAVSGLASYFRFYNHERPHQALAYHTPAQIYEVVCR